MCVCIRIYIHIYGRVWYLPLALSSFLGIRQRISITYVYTDSFVGKIIKPELFSCEISKTTLKNHIYIYICMNTCRSRSARFSESDIARCLAFSD